MPTIPPTDRSNYITEAMAADAALDEQLAIFRREEADGEITAVEAAYERVRALETHLATIRALRAKYFGGNDDDD
jgi:hypothetical protein